MRIDGIEYWLDLQSGQKTGFYLDQRGQHSAVAAQVRRLAAARPGGVRVLDAFCNQGPFALQCVRAGATQVLGLDSAGEAIDQARRNSGRNRLPAEFAVANVFDYFTERRDETWDLIILDPPPFAKSKGALAGAMRGYKEINLRAMQRLHAALTGPASLLEQESRWCEAMGLLVRRHARGIALPGREPVEVLVRVRERLRAQVGENVGLAQLAAEAGLSPWHLNRLFRQRFGLPPHAYQLQLRLARARILLQGDGPIAGIAGELGFADQAHLSRLFKRAFGVTPAGYRRS